MPPRRRPRPRRWIRRRHRRPRRWLRERPPSSGRSPRGRSAGWWSRTHYSRRMVHLLLLTNALALLSHQVRILPAEPTALVNAPAGEVVLVDARSELAQAKSLCRVLRATGLSSPLIAVLTEGGLAGLTSEWGVDDVILDSAGPAEVDARLRLAITRTDTGEDEESGPIRAGEVVIDEATYSARVRGQILDLTYKEFELLKFLAQHPGRVFSRAQLLQEVWGYDYFGGTRTVDVHVRRLRAKLGS